MFLFSLLAPFQPKQIAQGEEQEWTEEPAEDARHLMPRVRDRQRTDRQVRQRRMELVFIGYAVHAPFVQDDPAF